MSDEKSYFFLVTYLFDLVYANGTKVFPNSSYGSLRFSRNKKDISNEKEFRTIYDECTKFSSDELAKFPKNSRVENLIILNIQCLGVANDG